MPTHITMLVCAITSWLNIHHNMSTIVCVCVSICVSSQIIYPQTAFSNLPVNPKPITSQSFYAIVYHWILVIYKFMFSWHNTWMWMIFTLQQIKPVCVGVCVLPSKSSLLSLFRSASVISSVHSSSVTGSPVAAKMSFNSSRSIKPSPFLLYWAEDRSVEIHSNNVTHSCCICH